MFKGIGERLLPSWVKAELRPLLAFTGAGSALVAGSGILIHRGWDALSERLGGWEKPAALGFAGYVIVYGCIHAPHVARFAAPGAILVWCVAAWWIAPPRPSETDEEPPASGPADSFLVWLVGLMGERPGIHLRDLYPAMRLLPGHEGRDDAQMRAALKALDIPIRRSLRIGDVAGRSGVARADLPALPSPSGKPSGDINGDAGQATDSPAGEASGERAENA